MSLRVQIRVTPLIIDKGTLLSNNLTKLKRTSYLVAIVSFLADTVQIWDIRSTVVRSLAREAYPEPPSPRAKGVDPKTYVCGILRFIWSN